MTPVGQAQARRRHPVRHLQAVLQQLRTQLQLQLSLVRRGQTHLLQRVVFANQRIGLQLRQVPVDQSAAA